MDRAKQNMNKYRKRIGKAPLEVPATFTKTGFFFMGIELALVLPNTMNPQKAVPIFNNAMDSIFKRSLSPNLHDMYEAHLDLAETMRNGEFPLKSK